MNSNFFSEGKEFSKVANIIHSSMLMLIQESFLDSSNSLRLSRTLGLAETLQNSFMTLYYNFSMVNCGSSTAGFWVNSSWDQPLSVPFPSSLKKKSSDIFIHWNPTFCHKRKRRKVIINWLPVKIIKYLFIMWLFNNRDTGLTGRMMSY